MHIYKHYSFSWSCITLLFDYDALKRDFKIKPLSWNYRSKHTIQNFDKEREEFVISNYLLQTDKEIREEYLQISDDIYDNQGEAAFNLWRKENGNDYIEYWQRKGLKNISLDKYLKGIFISKESYDIYSGKGFESFVNHPLFKGFVSGKTSRQLHKQSMEKYKYRLNVA
jgi:predicted translin family RNA/ssDNA-binding protein